MPLHAPLHMLIEITHSTIQSNQVSGCYSTVNNIIYKRVQNRRALPVQFIINDGAEVLRNRSPVGLATEKAGQF